MIYLREVLKKHNSLPHAGYPLSARVLQSFEKLSFSRSVNQHPQRSSFFTAEDFSRYLDQRQRMAQEAREDLQQLDIDYQAAQSLPDPWRRSPLNAHWVKCRDNMKRICCSLPTGKASSTSSQAA